MECLRKRNECEEEELLQNESLTKQEFMRSFIAETASKLTNEKLLEMLYIRAKTLRYL